MKQPHVLLKVAAVVSALLLTGGLVSYRAGAFNRLMKPSATQPAPTMLGGSKSKVLIEHTLADMPGAQPTAAEKPAPTFMGGSKSFDTPGTLTGPVLTPPVIPSVIDVPSK